MITAFTRTASAAEQSSWELEPNAPVVDWLSISRDRTNTALSALVMWRDLRGASRLGTEVGLERPDRFPSLVIGKPSDVEEAPGVPNPGPQDSINLLSDLVLQATMEQETDEIIIGNTGPEERARLVHETAQRIAGGLQLLWEYARLGQIDILQGDAPGDIFKIVPAEGQDPHNNPPMP